MESAWWKDYNKRLGFIPAIEASPEILRDFMIEHVEPCYCDCGPHWAISDLVLYGTDYTGERRIIKVETYPHEVVEGKEYGLYIFDLLIGLPILCG